MTVDDMRFLADEVRRLRDEVSTLSKFLQTAPGVRTTYIETNTAMVRLAGGLRLYVDSRDIGIASHLMHSGIWEGPYTRQVQRLVKSGQVCVDVGANFGYYSVIMGSLVGVKGKVFSFEPNPRLYDLLSRSMRVNGFVMSGVSECHRCALSDTRGPATLGFKEGDFGGGSILTTEKTRQAMGLSQVEVEMKRLDDFSIDPCKPLFVKIDAEGAEYLILKGGEQILRNAADIVMLMEFTPLFIRKHMPVAEFVNYLQRWGLRFFVAQGETLVEKQGAEVEALGNCYVFMARRDISS